MTYGKGSYRICKFVKHLLHFEMKEFLCKNKSFQSVYDYAILMLQDWKELMQMFLDLLEKEDIAASLNATNESIIKRQAKQIEEQKQQIATLQQQLLKSQNQLDK